MWVVSTSLLKRSWPVEDGLSTELFWFLFLFCSLRGGSRSRDGSEAGLLLFTVLIYEDYAGQILAGDMPSAPPDAYAWPPSDFSLFLARCESLSAFRIGPFDLSYELVSHY